MYGVFAFLSKMARGEGVAARDEFSQPLVSMRWVDQWDNLNGTIERGMRGHRFSSRMAVSAAI